MANTPMHFYKIWKCITSVSFFFILAIGVKAQNPHSSIHFNLFDPEKIVFKASAQVDYSGNLTDSTGKYTITSTRWDISLFDTSDVFSNNNIFDTLNTFRLPNDKHYTITNYKGDYIDWHLGFGGNFELTITKNKQNGK